MVITFSSEENLVNWGRRVGQLLRPHDVVFLKGPLGAGKTTLVKAMAEGYGVLSDEVTSPTFNLHHQMENHLQQVVHHLDGYRVEEAKEYEQMGLDFLPAGLIFVEWPEKYLLHSPTLTILFSVQNNDRQISLEGDPRHPVFELSTEV